MPCDVCGGRVMKTEAGKRCLNDACAGSAEGAVSQEILCRCGNAMAYTGLNQLGEPVYRCSVCGSGKNL
jgi:hypothetical protein